MESEDNEQMVRESVMNLFSSFGEPISREDLIGSLQPIMRQLQVNAIIQLNRKVSEKEVDRILAAFVEEEYLETHTYDEVIILYWKPNQTVQYFKL
jgi:hypothetical protein